MKWTAIAGIAVIAGAVMAFALGPPNRKVDLYVWDEFVSGGHAVEGVLVTVEPEGVGFLQDETGKRGKSSFTVPAATTFLLVTMDYQGCTATEAVGLSAKNGKQWHYIDLVPEC